MDTEVTRSVRTGGRRSVKDDLSKRCEKLVIHKPTSKLVLSSCQPSRDVAPALRDADPLDHAMTQDRLIRSLVKLSTRRVG